MYLDLRGEECPIPTVKAIDGMNQAAPEEELIVLTDDPICAAEIPLQASHRGFSANSERREDSEWLITLTPVAGKDPNRLDREGEGR